MKNKTNMIYIYIALGLYVIGYLSFQIPASAPKAIFHLGFIGYSLTWITSTILSFQISKRKKDHNHEMAFWIGTILIYLYFLSPLILAYLFITR